MPQIPEKIKIHRLPGTEIKCIQGKYYLQTVKSVWDPQKQKVRKVTTGYLGRVTEKGLIPKKCKKVPVNEIPYSKEFGATWTIMSLTSDIYKLLQKHFPDDADWLYTTALLRCIKHNPMRYTEALYDASYISEVIPNLKLSSSNLSNLMTSFGYRRREMVSFMKDCIPSEDCFMIFDGTTMVCNSENIFEAQRGYNSHGLHDPQINILYAISIKDNKLMPIFYKRYPGSIRDVTAFPNFREEMGIKNVVAICDKGFAKKSDQTNMEEAGIDYLMPLKRNSGEYVKEPIYQPGTTGYTSRFTYNGRIIWCYEQPSTNEDNHRMIIYLDEALRHAELSNIRNNDNIGKETPEEIKKIAEHQLYAGTICLKTSLKDYDPELIYKTYKMRGEIEQLFDTYKCEQDFNTTGMHSAETQEACLFLNHLSVIMAYKVHERLRDNKQDKNFAAVKMPELLLWDVRVTNSGNKWQLEPITKAARKAFNALGLTPPEILD